MSSERVILCGEAESPTRPGGGKEPIRLQLWGLDPNITLRIRDISKAFAANLSEVCIDLIEIATYVFCADQAITRGGETDPYMGENFRRQLNFHIPVRQPDIWKSKDIKDCLTSTLNFLSDDFYHFHFSQLINPPPFMRYLEGMGDSSLKPDEILLFSGGLDSLAGAIQEAVIEKKRIILVSHRSAPKILPKQRELVTGLNKYSPDHALHVPVWITKHNLSAREFTQRSRSFLFAALGATVAQLFNLPGIHMYENGIISMNLPISAQVIGARATRSTHPRVLKGFSELFSLIFDRPFKIENPFIWETRAEVVTRISEAGCADLIKDSVSCSRVMEMTNWHTHCGRCSQCIDRRFAILASGNYENDPWDMYKVDLLKGSRESLEDKTMLESFVKTAIQVAQMTDREFFSSFSEATRFFSHLDGTSDEIATKIFEMHQRHAREICGVIENSFKEHTHEILEGALPPSCLLILALPKDYKISKDLDVTEPESVGNTFRKQGHFWRIIHDRKEILLKDAKGLHYIAYLLRHPGQDIHVLKLIQEVDGYLPGDDFEIYRHIDEGQLIGEGLSFSSGNAGELVDTKAIAAYKQEISNLEEEIREAEENNDSFRLHALKTKKEFLVDHIKAATGLLGRPRKFIDGSEKKRKSIFKSINNSREKILKHHPVLGKHFENCIKTGQSCSYTPDKPITWET